jgi:hypothetical protein
MELALKVLFFKDTLDELKKKSERLRNENLKECINQAICNTLKVYFEITAFKMHIIRISFLI